MKYRTFLIACSGVLFALFFAFFTWMKDQYATPTPEPSVWGGYYEDAFLLELIAPANGKIYYTTDGSTPTTSAQQYDGGIFIQDRSQEPDVCASVQNIILDWKTYTPNPAPVEKGTVIRAVYVNELGMQSDVLTQTYFVGIEPPPRGYTLSLVFEYDDLFGENGIYVTGKEYDDWYLSGETDTQAPIPNFNKDLEVMAVAELMDDSGDVMNQPVGLQLQGASARKEYQKRFTLVSRLEYSGSDVFDATLFEGVTTHSVMVKHYLPDAIASDLLADRSVATQASVPVRVYLNGEFWYNSFMLERYDEHYFRQHYQVEDRVLIKNGTMDEESLASAEVDFYSEFMYWVEHADFSDPQSWEQFQEEAVVQSYIDYLVANYFFCNIDYNDQHNYVLWCSPFTANTQYEDMRWRWCVYDIDALEWVENKPTRGKAAAVNVFSNEFSMDMNDSALYRALRRSPEFCQQFVLSFMDILNNNFSPANVEPVLTKYGYTMDWKDGYFLKRPAYAVQHLAEEFNLSGTLETVTITSSHPEMGSVTVNTSEIELSSGSWSGQYFTDYPITVTASANDGYQFLGWKGDANEASNTVTLSVDGGVSLEAVFAKSE